MIDEDLVRTIEALVLVSQEPVRTELLAQFLEVSAVEVDAVCGQLSRTYEEAGHGFQLVKVAGDGPLAHGRHRLVMTFEYDGGGPGLGGVVRLLVDGDVAAEGRLERTVPLVFSLDETLDVGRDSASPVSDDYTAEGSAFTGAIHQVRLEIAEDATDFSHLIDPRQRLAVALARQ